MTRTIIIVDPERLNGKITGVLATKEPPREGELVILTDSMEIADYGAGKVCHVYTNPRWPTTWLYDVMLEKAANRPAD